MATTAERLQTILDNSDGIFNDPKLGPPKTNGIAETLEKPPILPTTIDDIIEEFNDNVERFVVDDQRISFDIAPISTDTFIKAIKKVREKQSTKQLSHLGILYGLSDDNKMVLTMRGVKFNTTNPSEDISRENTSDRQFTTLDLAPRLRKLSDARPVENFKEVFTKIHLGKDKFVTIAYIKFDPLIDRLKRLQEDGFSEITIKFGFLGAKEKDDLNCFHLIFTGLTSGRGISTSGSTFSTLDSTTTYDGPKPGCPPFGSVDEGGFS